MTTCSTEPDLNRRFGGIARLYGVEGLARLQQAHVCVIGVGGVGSWAVEALARSGMGQLTLIDLDSASESNINRQLVALDSTLGKAKVSILKERCFDINPLCSITAIEDFVELETINTLITPNFDYVIDCIDNSKIKAALIAHCKRQKIKIITLGGAGGQKDPTKIRLTDLTKSLQDPLLSKVRKLLRQDYHFSRNPKRRFDVPCVWSEETMSFADNASAKTGLTCAGGLGSVMTVTATFALVAVSHVLDKLTAPSKENGNHPAG